MQQMLSSPIQMREPLWERRVYNCICSIYCSLICQCCFKNSFKYFKKPSIALNVFEKQEDIQILRTKKQVVHIYFTLLVKSTKSLSSTYHAAIHSIKGIFRPSHQCKPTWVVKTIWESPSVFTSLNIDAFTAEKHIRPIWTFSQCHIRVKKLFTREG